MAVCNVDCLQVGLLQYILCLSCRKEDVEAKYYADGEDAFAMRRELSALAEQVERERQSQRRKALPAPTPTDSSTVT